MINTATNLDLTPLLKKRYQIMASELMLYPNQSQRGIDKFGSFIHLQLVADEQVKRIESNSSNSKLSSEKQHFEALGETEPSFMSLYRKSEDISVSEILKAKEISDENTYSNHTIPNRVFIQGRAGVGKTTLLTYMAYLWSQNKLFQDFTVVWHIKLRDLINHPQQKLSLENVLYQHCIKGLNLDYKEFLEYWQNIKESQQKILYLLDGYDEVASLDSENYNRLHVFVEKELLSSYSESTLILTSRPTAPKFPGPNARHIEIMGFQDQDIEAYINTYFSNFKTNTKSDINNSPATRLLNDLKSQPMAWNIAHTPVNLAMICELYNNQNENLQFNTLTDLYCVLVEDIFQREVKKTNLNKTNKKAFNVFSIEAITAIDRDVSIHFLSELAYLGLIKNQYVFKGYNRLNHRSLSEPDIIDIMALAKQHQLDKFDLEKVIFSPFLKIIAYTDDWTKNDYYFPHLTFQEFFAAKYIAQQLKTNQPAVIEKLAKQISEIKYQPRFQLMLAFVAGLCVDSAKALTLFAELLLAQPRDIIGLYETQLWMRILEESQQNNKITPIFKNNTGVCQQIENIKYLLNKKLIEGDVVFDRIQTEYKKNIYLCRILCLEFNVIEKLEAALNRHDKNEVIHALDLLDHMPFINSQDIKTHLITLLSFRNSAIIRRSAIRLLKKYSYDPDEKLKSHLLSQIKETDPEMRQTGLYALESFDFISENDFDELIKLLSDENEKVRKASANLCKHKVFEKQFVNLRQVIFTLLKSNAWPDRDVGAISCSRIEFSEDDEIKNILVSLLNNDENSSVICSVLSTLSNISFPKNFEIVANCLHLLTHNEWAVRADVVELFIKYNVNKDIKIKNFLLDQVQYDVFKEIKKDDTSDRAFCKYFDINRFQLYLHALDAIDRINFLNEPEFSEILKFWHTTWPNSVFYDLKFSLTTFLTNVQSIIGQKWYGHHVFLIDQLKEWQTGFVLLNNASYISKLNKKINFKIELNIAQKVLDFAISKSNSEFYRAMAVRLLTYLQLPEEIDLEIYLKLLLEDESGYDIIARQAAKSLEFLEMHKKANFVNFIMLFCTDINRSPNNNTHCKLKFDFLEKFPFDIYIKIFISASEAHLKKNKDINRIPLQILIKKILSKNASLCMFQNSIVIYSLNNSFSFNVSEKLYSYIASQIPDILLVFDICFPKLAIQYEKEVPMLTTITKTPSSVETIPQCIDSIKWLTEYLQSDLQPSAKELIQSIIDYGNKLLKLTIDLQKLQSHPKKNSDMILQRFDSIYDDINSFRTKMLNVTLNKIARTDIESILDEIQEYYQNWQDSINKKMLSFKYIPKKNLFQDCQQLHKNPLFEKALNNIKKFYNKAEFTQITCFISYDWPSFANTKLGQYDEDEMEFQSEIKQDENWIKPFLLLLAEHLKQAGINVVLDIGENRNSPYGSNIYQFMERAPSNNCILLIGTEKLLTKHQQGLNTICSELMQVEQRRLIEMKRAPRIFPILLSDSSKAFFPIQIERYSATKNWQKKSYHENIQDLICGIYGLSHDNKDYQNLWESFNAEQTVTPLKAKTSNPSAFQGNKTKMPKKPSLAQTSEKQIPTQLDPSNPQSSFKFQATSSTFFQAKPSSEKETIPFKTIMGNVSNFNKNDAVYLLEKIKFQLENLDTRYLDYFHSNKREMITKDLPSSIQYQLETYSDSDYHLQTSCNWLLEKLISIRDIIEPKNEIQSPKKFMKIEMIDPLKNVLNRTQTFNPTDFTNSFEIDFAEEKRRCTEYKVLSNNSDFIAWLIRVEKFASQPKKTFTPKRLFISHAWSMKESNEFPQEAWVDDLVKCLYLDLKTAGVKPYLDLYDSSNGYNMLKFMRKINKPQVGGVLFICSRAYQYKEILGNTGIEFELNETLNRIKNEKLELKRFAIPICLTKKSFVPNKLSSGAERNIYKDGYLQVLRNLLVFAYGFNEETFDNDTQFHLVKDPREETHILNFRKG